MKKDQKLKALQRLWKDFPELWAMCQQWRYGGDILIPSVTTVRHVRDLDNENPRQGQWWTVSDSSHHKCRIAAKLPIHLSTLVLTLTDFIDWNKYLKLEYFVNVPTTESGLFTANRGLRIFKPVRGKTFEEILRNKV